MIPDTLRYSKSHEWARFEGDLVTIGVTKFATDQLTDITYIELPHVGDHVFAGQECGTIETVKAVSSLYAPVDGEVVAVNDKIIEDPNGLTADPYGSGWLFQVRVEKPGADQNLLDARLYAKQVQSAGH